MSWPIPTPGRQVTHDGAMSRYFLTGKDPEDRGLKVLTWVVFGLAQLMASVFGFIWFVDIGAEHSAWERYLLAGFVAFWFVSSSVVLILLAEVEIQTPAAWVLVGLAAASMYAAAILSFDHVAAVWRFIFPCVIIGPALAMNWLISHALQAFRDAERKTSSDAEA